MIENEDTEMPTDLGSKGLALVGIMKYLKAFWNEKNKFPRLSSITIKECQSIWSKVNKGYAGDAPFPERSMF